jgi:hypothetical protein
MESIQEINGTLVAYNGSLPTNASLTAGGSLSSSVGEGISSLTSGGYGYYQSYPTLIHWNSYPVYVTSDKTAKAIEILKTLQDEKLIDVKSVPKFIALVEKIKGLL